MATLCAHYCGKRGMAGSWVLQRRDRQQTWWGGGQDVQMPAGNKDLPADTHLAPGVGGRPSALVFSCALK